MSNLFKSRQQIADELQVDVKTVVELFASHNIIIDARKRVCPKDWQELYRQVAPELLKTT